MVRGVKKTKRALSHGRLSPLTLLYELKPPSYPSFLISPSPISMLSVLRIMGDGVLNLLQLPAGILQDFIGNVILKTPKLAVRRLEQSLTLMLRMTISHRRTDFSFRFFSSFFTYQMDGEFHSSGTNRIESAHAKEEGSIEQALSKV
jgi:hypothetical protein